MIDLAPAFQRYRPLIDDWDAFQDAVRRALPACIWVRPELVRAARLREALVADGLTGRPLPWLPEGIRLDEPPDLPGSLSYRAGLVHVLEEVSMLPVALLEPLPGERILDLCAAPGNKTALIAASMRGTGTVVANDPAGGRQAVTRTTLHRMGLCNVTLTVRDGTDSAWQDLGFDRVLVDAPCSCEGTVRKHPATAVRTTAAMRTRLVDLQTRLLRNAVRSCRPGGRIVYATCTFAPEENEGVVSAVLAASGMPVRMVPPGPAAGAFDRGLASWQGTAFHPDVRHAVRVWPHHTDSGGFFCAVLERTGAQASRPPEAAASARPADALRPILDWFGIPEETVSHLTYRPESRKYGALVARDHDPGLPFRPLATGLAAVRVQSRVPKPTTQAAIAIGRHATRNVVDLDRDGALAFVRRASLPLDSPAAGYQIVRWLGHPLGIGLARSGSAGSILDSLYPRIWAGMQPVDASD